MNTFFTSDWHMFHGNIIKYCHRPFANKTEKELLELADKNIIDQKTIKISQESIELMNDAIINNVNSIVKKNDVLWILGDFCFPSNIEVAKNIRDKIICENINLVWGNHDKYKIKPIFNETYEQILINVEGQKIFLNHYPLRTWNQSHRGSWNLFGHVHGLLFENDKKSDILSLDVGVDTHNFQPWSMEEIRKYMAPKIELWKEKQRKLNV